MKVGRFTLLQELASGASGTVWTARHDSGHPAAVKLLKEASLAARFELELQAISGLHHPNIVQVFDAGTTRDQAWLAMELLTGGPLHLRVPGAWPERRRVLQELLEGLAHAHAAGLVHLDVKPPNLLIDRQGRVKLADFGVASRIGLSPERVLGTPAFMAPEQLTRGARLGPWTDLYAVGMLAWWLATDSLPWTHADAGALMRAQRFEELPDFRARGEVPREVEGWVRALLDKRAERRPQHALEALRALPGACPAPRGWASRTSSRPGAGLVALRETPFAGRGREREHVRQQLLLARDESTVRALVVTGPAGVGKSRLARWSLHRAREQALAEGLSVAGDQLAQALAGAQRRRAAGSDEELSADLPPARLLEKLASWARGPLLLHLDDPGPEQVLLAEALLDLGTAPALLVLTLRSERLATRARLAELVDRLTSRDRCRRMDLEPLDEPAQLELARSLLDMDEGSLVALARRSAGNPLVLEQLVTQALAGGQLEPGPWGHRLRAGAALELPEDLRAGWARRVAEMPLPWRQALLVAALLGNEVDRRAWHRACAELGLQPDPELLRALERWALAQRCATGWRFTHGLLRESLCSLPDEQSARGLHEACAVALGELDGSADRRARHLVAAGHHQAALPLLEQAIREAGEAAGPRRELVALLRTASEALGRSDEVTRVLLDLHDLRVLLVEGREDLALPRIRGLIPRARAAGMAPAVIELTIQAGRASLDAGKPDLAREQLHRAVDRASRQAPQLLGWAAHQAAWAECVMGDPGEALQLVSEALEAGTRPVLVAHLRAVAGYAHAMAGRPETGRRELAEARRTMEELGPEQELVRMDTHRVLIDAVSGRRQPALERARSLLDRCRIGRLRQHLLAAVLCLELEDGPRPGQIALAQRLARSRWQTYDVRLQASGALLALDRAEQEDLELLDRGCATVLDPLLLLALSAGSSAAARTWPPALAERLEAARD